MLVLPASCHFYFMHYLLLINLTEVSTNTSTRYIPEPEEKNLMQR